MISEYIAPIVDTIKSNAFFQGGFVIALLAGLAAYARALPRQIRNVFIRYGTVTISFNSDDSLFKWFIQWLDSQPFTHNKTTLRATTKEANAQVNTVYALAEGNYIVRLKGLWTYIGRHKEESKGGEATLANLMPKEMFTLQVFRWNRKKLYKLVESICADLSNQHKDKVILYEFSWGSWEPVASQPKKDLGHTILRAGVKEELLADIEDFQKSEAWYAERGIPYQRGYLLEGLPGTGKTSLIYGLASQLDYKLCPIKLSSITDERMAKAFLTVPPRSIIVIEDIDAFFNGRKCVIKKDGTTTFSGLLNAINGLAVAHGRLLFITTNHVEKLDAALLRVGRLDKQLRFDHVDSHQAQQLFLAFFPGEVARALEFGEQCAKHQFVPASIQEHLTGCRNNPQRAIDLIPALVLDVEQRKNTPEIDETDDEDEDEDDSNKPTVAVAKTKAS